MNSDSQETVQLETLKEDIQTVGAFIPVICCSLQLCISSCSL